ncbi:MAG TPA: NUMOD3 domain-containing DNA-binding protein [Reyranella sp.]|nr:NUMOD3 domain-containing DNA-binding protein [Reyranella sp.]HTE82913.1 NUMOD3 domain-containing DNA-binding protein [Reyranella sp.]
MTRPKFPKVVTVYALESTRDRRVRYIGQTAGFAKDRLTKHLKQARVGRTGILNNWMRAEIAEGFAIVMTVIAEAGTRDETAQRLFAAAGCDLLVEPRPAGHGPRANFARVVSAETRERLSAAGTGRFHTEATKKKISRSMFRCPSVETRNVAQSPVIAGEGLDHELVHHLRKG